MNLENIAAILVVVMIGFLIVRKIFSSGSCCGSHNSHGRATDKQIPSAGETVHDPVCGMNIDREAAIVKELNGINYYFCCQSCVKKFEAKNSRRTE
jgi:YHS domain-containing protein